MLLFTIITVHSNIKAYLFERGDHFGFLCFWWAISGGRFCHSCLHFTFGKFLGVNSDVHPLRRPVSAVQIQQTELANDLGAQGLLCFLFRLLHRTDLFPPVRTRGTKKSPLSSEILRRV